MDRFELRFDRVDQGLHLGFLRIGQVEHVAQHHGHIRWAVVVPVGSAAVWCFSAGEMAHGEHCSGGNSAKDQFVRFHFFVG